MSAIRVAASAQYGVDGQTDVFTISDLGQLQVSWVVDAGNWNGPVGLGPVGLYPPGAAIAVSPQYGIDGQTDVFAIAGNGQLQVSWVVDAGNWNGPVGLGPVGLYPAGISLAASPQYGLRGQTDVFAVAGNGQLQVSWVVDAGTWNGPVSIGQVDVPVVPELHIDDLGTGAFLATGQGFTHDGPLVITYQFQTAGLSGLTQGDTDRIPADFAGSFEKVEFEISNTSSAHDMFFQATDLASGRKSNSVGPLRPAI